jgi:outer membrane protein assembly factor BamB
MIAVAAAVALGPSTALHPEAAAASAKKEPITLIVMDPLARELACACVRGHAQRNYHELALYLGKALSQKVLVSFSDDLTKSIAKTEPQQELLVIGKQSVIEHDAGAAKFKYRPLCRLTGKDGSTTLTGLFVAKMLDPAKRLEDIGARRILFGSTNADEKYSAAMDALRAAGVAIPAKIQTREACSDAAIDVLDSQEEPAPVGLISSYALPLLEGCGTIKKGDLKVIGETKPVPFVAVFCSDNIPADKQQKIRQALFAVAKKVKLTKALESRNGFIPFEPNEPSPAMTTSVDSKDWPDWRGSARDGHIAHLPARLPEQPRLVWRQAAMIGGLAGISMAAGRVLVADRDPADERDVFRCLNADNGELLWLLDYSAPGKLDYGQFPRAAPVIRNGKVFLLGAFGQLTCVNLADGKVIWKRHMVRDLHGRQPTWGYCSTPLAVGELLIVNPGGAASSLVALDGQTGKTRWKCPGNPAAYASFIAGTFGGTFQIVGFDKASLGGWDPVLGRRLWTLTPPLGDFNVPTPLAVNGNLLVATENNGARLYGFGPDGKLNPMPLANYAELAPTTTTPVAANGRIFGCHLGIHCLNGCDNLKCIWREPSNAFGDHATLFSDNERVLVVSLSGELFLLSAKADKYEIISRSRLFEQDAEVYSHPALVNDRLYIRGPSSICCFDLADQ